VSGKLATEARTALVTGASSGIGAATARALGELGWAVAIGARRVERLEEVASDVEKAGGRPFAHALDVTQPGSIETFFAAAEGTLGPVDVVVSNAGAAVAGLLHELRVEELESEVATNLLGPMLVARRALPSMLEQKRGDLVFITSLNVVLPRPFQTGYTATKSGIEGLARALQMELEGTGVRTTIVRPGPTKTEFGWDWDRNLIKRILESWEHWGVLHHHHYLPAERVAEAVVTAVMAPAGARLDVIQLNPEAPKGARRARDE
jgi:NADP-dependent 3-hydroxy acid dehydrogenase YdfG